MPGILSKDYRGTGVNAQGPQTPYVHQPYPSVRYHRSHTAENPVTKLVNSDEEHEALVADGDWADTPAAFEEGYVALVPEATADTKAPKARKTPKPAEAQS